MEPDGERQDVNKIVNVENPNEEFGEKFKYFDKEVPPQTQIWIDFCEKNVCTISCHKEIPIIIVNDIATI